MISLLSLLLICVTPPSETGAPAPVAVGPRVIIRTIDSDSMAATFVAMSPTAVDVVIDGERREFDIDDVLRIAPVDADGAPNSADRGAVACYPVVGGLLNGHLIGGDATGSVRLLIVGGETVNVPFASLAAIRFGRLRDGPVIADFESRRLQRRAGRDLLMLFRDGRITTVPGALESVSPEGWVFAFGGKARTGRLGQAVGIILGSASLRGRRPPVAVSIVGESRFFASVVGADSVALTVDAGPLGRITLPWSIVRSLDLESGRITKISDIEPAAMTCVTVLGGDWPARRNRNVAGGPIRIGSKDYGDGWGVHARSRLEFDLDGEYERFVADVGVDASVAPRGSVVFRVIVDGNVMFESKTLHGGEAAARVGVDITGGRRLVLECDRADGLDLSDHGNWAHAYLVRRKKGGNS